MYDENLQLYSITMHTHLLFAFHLLTKERFPKLILEFTHQMASHLVFKANAAGC